ncbi:MAG: histidinol dehydrogenase [Bacteroidetes bacterium]|nr:histidinol dehydrogenase [Bacteroidota bacterium]
MMLPVYLPANREDYFRKLQSRRLFDSTSLNEQVSSILREVRVHGDAAVRAFTRRFDGFDPDPIRVPESDWTGAASRLEPGTREILGLAIERIRNFHLNQQEQSWTVAGPYGEILGQKVTPLERVGVYVPGGKAFYPSSLLMNVIPAQVAGVDEIVVVTPAGKDGRLSPVLLGACDLLGIKEIYRIGGAQAVAALAFGTESVRPVDMITGPGNQYVAKAKQLVFGFVKIDSIAGPSEVTIIADDTADTDALILDLFSQAEHDEQAAVTLISLDPALPGKLQERLPALLEIQPRKAIIAASLQSFGGLLPVDSVEEAFELANRIAPEHLELLLDFPESHLYRVRHAGAVFIGHWSPEAAGDYLAGPNHVLPTCGTARFFSPLGVYDFMKRTSVIHLNEEAMKAIGPAVAAFADLESLTAHGDSARLRTGKTGQSGS